MQDRAATSPLIVIRHTASGKVTGQATITRPQASSTTSSSFTSRFRVSLLHHLDLKCSSSDGALFFYINYTKATTYWSIGAPRGPITTSRFSPHLTSRITGPMATWAYPPLPADQLKREEETALVSSPRF